MEIVVVPLTDIGDAVLVENGTAVKVRVNKESECHQTNLSVIIVQI